MHALLGRTKEAVVLGNLKLPHINWENINASRANQTVAAPQLTLLHSLAQMLERTLVIE